MKKIALFVAAALLAGTTISCHHTEADEHDHEHSHGEQMTAYSNDFELFAEVNSLIVGEDCDILAHFTRLSNFKPLDSTKVVMKVKVGDKVQEVAIEKPSQAGIYRFEVTPEVAGCGSINFEVMTGDTISYIGFGHVHVYADRDAMEKHSHGHSHEGHGHSHEGHSHEGHDHGHAEASANAITFTKEQSWKVDFATEKVEKVKFGRIIKTSAQVLPSAGDEREIAAKASGIVVFGSNLVDGSKVSAGQKLFTIESSGMADNNMGVRFQEAESAYKLAKSEYERKQKLAEDKIVSQSDLQRAKMELESAQAIYNNLKNNFSSRGQHVSAPISGYVKNIQVKNGSYVEAGQVIASVSQNKEISIRAEVQPRYYEDLAHVQRATIRLMNSDEVYCINGMGGNSSYVYGRSTDPSNPMIPVTFTFPNKVNLVSGSFVNLYITTEGENEVVTIPNTGIVEDMGAHFVFVQINPEQFEKREVTLGVTNGERTVLASGVKAGERVVSKGAIMVKLAAGAGALDPHAGHVH